MSLIHPNIEKEFVQLHYEQSLSNVRQNELVLVSHLGQLNQIVISNIENNIEEKTSAAEITKNPAKKIFFISVEALQNMLIHGHKDKDGEQHNFFIFSKKETVATIISANLVSNDVVSELDKKIQAINSFDDEKKLKAFYLEHLENNTMSDKGGAGLGFITIVMKSGHKLKTEFKKINDDCSLFIFTSTIDLV